MVALLPGSDVPIELFNEQDVPLPGKHNLSNAMAAGVVATRYGAHPDAINRGLSGFRGLPHRLQFVGRVGKVRFYDDSKATNVEAALAALGAFTRDVVLIAGGKHKGSSYRALWDGLARCGRAVVLIGQAAPYLKEDLDGVVAVHEASDLEEAVVMAWELAKPEGTVLLAPACSSFDMFRDFNHRGEVFQTAVERIVTREGAAV